MKNSPIGLLVVDDDPAMRRVLMNSLGPVGYSVEEAVSGEAGMRALDRSAPELVLLDMNMPGMSGVETCRRMRQLVPNLGIVMTSVSDREDDKVNAFHAGADDYITKPFRFRELMARLEAVRRRVAPSFLRSEVFSAGALRLDTAKRKLFRDEVEIHLSQKEFEILSFLMSHPDTSIPHARLLKAVWGPEYGGETEYLRTYVRLLRKKIERNADAPEYIVTEPWVGYRFCDPRRSQAAA